MRFIDILFPPREDERALREVSLTAFCSRLSPCIIAMTRSPAAGLFLFTDPVVRTAIHEAKYHGSAHAFSLLAGALADYLPEYASDSLETFGPVSLVPVPLGRERRRERGYNQVEEVARRARRSLATPGGSGMRSGGRGGPGFALETRLLERTRETPTQISLTREA